MSPGSIPSRHTANSLGRLVKQAPPKHAGATANTQGQTVNQGRTCSSKKKPAHMARPQQSAAQLSAQMLNKPKLPKRSSIPKQESTNNIASFAKQFMKRLGPQGVVQLAAFSAEFMKPRNGRLVTGLAQAASLGMTLHEDKKAGQTTKEAILNHAPEIATSAIDVAVNLSSLLARAKYKTV
ncbi:hypothetical protein TDB9533_00049 [Thalassocella blandensis]|nr:hypothetical protein TDB9533_00049 [Thalassocella blandensis]